MDGKVKKDKPTYRDSKQRLFEFWAMGDSDQSGQAPM